MWLDQPVNGRSLPNKTLCLTFDDGPGPHTLDVAHYLAEERICATFFVVGKHVQHRPGDVAELRMLGHEIGNHSVHHLHLTDSFLSVEDIRAEVNVAGQPTDRAILFRPPYGAWTPRLSYWLNQNSLGNQQLGPVNWDIGGFDFKYWAASKLPQPCASAYARSVKSGGRGIILLHDHSADLQMPKMRIQTLRLLQILVPQLRSEGYTFTSLNSVPEIHRLSAEASFRRDGDPSTS